MDMLEAGYLTVGDVLMKSERWKRQCYRLLWNRGKIGISKLEVDECRI